MWRHPYGPGHSGKSSNPLNRAWHILPPNAQVRRVSGSRVIMLVMALVAVIIFIALGLLGLGALGTFAVGIGSMIVMPIMAVVGSFIGAAIMFVIWKLMGTQESFDVAIGVWPMPRQFIPSQLSSA